jgi:hypothetical protein
VATAQDYLSNPNDLYNNVDTSSGDSSSGFDPLTGLPEIGAQSLSGFASNALGMATQNDLPLAMLNNVSPYALSPSGSPNATFAPTGATPAQVRQAIGANGLSQTGAGVKVGVLSDSFNYLGGAATDESDGALPSTVQVLEDLPAGGATKGTDEGRAMLQVIHDIAPGASLAFYTGDMSEQDFANGILALGAAGCNVICDDLGYFDEPFFQSGVVSEAIKTVESQGVTYLTAAGNNAANAYQGAWSSIASTTFDGRTLTDTQNFGTAANPNPVQTITVGGTSSNKLPLVLEWNQPYGGVSANLGIDVFSNGSFLGRFTDTGNNTPTKPWVQVNLSGGATYQIAVENLSGSSKDPGLIKDIAAGDGLPVTIDDANAGASFGHATTSGAITVGAVDSGKTPAFGVNQPVNEGFSSSGLGSELFFNPDGPPFSYGPDPVDAVTVSGVDDIKTSLPSTNSLNDFFGTSCATPSLAAVVALMLQANPHLTPTQVKNILRGSIVGMGGDFNVSGAGLVQANFAVAGANSPQPTNSAIVQTSNGSLDYLQFTGTNLEASDLISPTNWPIRAEGSFNNDGGLTTQLVAQDPNSGAIDLLFLHDGNLYASDLMQGSYWKVVAAGDFTGNGTTGIATQNTATGQIDLLWFTGTQLTRSELLNGAYQPVVGASDIDGDGKTELITQNAGGGPLDFLHFSGANLTSSFLTSDSYWPVHDATNFGPYYYGQSLLLSQSPTSGALDYLEFNGTSLFGSQLENGTYPGLTPIQGTQAALNLFPV